MRRQISFAVPIILLLFVSCVKKADKPDYKKLLEGPWDSFRAVINGNTLEGPAAWVLCCYEQGFEISKDGSYKPRYSDNNNPSLYLATSQDPDLGGQWGLNRDTLTFINLSANTTSKFEFLILSIDDKEMILKYPFADYPIYFFKKKK